MASSPLRLALAVAALISAPSVSIAAPVPDSFQVFCAFNPSECKPGGASSVALTEDVAATLLRVNARVNRSIRPQRDNPLVQVWRVNPRSGDCKSYAISKRHELIRAGLPASALRIGVGISRGEQHAVLLVSTADGFLVLDNLTDKILPIAQNGIRLSATSTADPMVWK